MLPTELGIALGHLDVRVAQYLRELVKIAAVHHVPGGEGMTQIVESEILNSSSIEQVFKATRQQSEYGITGPEFSSVTSS